MGTATTWDPDLLVPGEASHNMSAPRAVSDIGRSGADRASDTFTARARFAGGECGEDAETCLGERCWLEAYWGQVRTLEVHLAYADGLYVRSILTRFDVRRELIGAYRKKQVERMTDAGGDEPGAAARAGRAVADWWV
jgi:hypothetical protein